MALTGLRWPPVMNGEPKCITPCIHMVRRRHEVATLHPDAKRSRAAPLQVGGSPKTVFRPMLEDRGAAWVSD